MTQAGPFIPRGLVTTTQRTLRVLEAVAESGDGTTAKAVARRTGLSPSTVYQYLNTLVHEGYLLRLHDAGGYGLGWRASALRLSSVTKTATVAAMYDLHQQAGAPLLVIRFRGMRPEITEVFDSPIYPRAREDIVSFTRAVHASAFGRVLLSSLSEKDRRGYLADAGMSRLTSATPTRLQQLEERIDEIRHTGIAIEYGEFLSGLVCMAVPIVDTRGTVTGAVAASSSEASFTSRRLQIENAIRHVAARLSPGIRPTASGPRSAEGAVAPSTPSGEE